MIDAVVIGSGPNGLAAAITLARAGRRVRVYEAEPTIGGGMRSAALTESGFTHDVCSTVFALVLASPFLKSLPLSAHGLEFAHPLAPFAHPLDDGTAVVVERSIEATAESIGAADAYRVSRPGRTIRGRVRPVDGGAVVAPRIVEQGAASMADGVVRSHGIALGVRPDRGEVSIGARSRDVCRRGGAQHGTARLRRNRRLRARPDPGGTRCGLAGRAWRRTDAGGRAGVVPALPGRRDRAGPARRVVGATPAVARDAVRHHAAPVPENRGRSPARDLSGQTRPLSLRSWRVQDGLGAERAGAVACERMRARRHGSSRRNVRRNRRKRTCILARADPRTAVRPGRPAQLCSTPPARRQESTRCGRTAMCRTVQRQT